jgi:hypothetical protein
MGPGFLSLMWFGPLVKVQFVATRPCKQGQLFQPLHAARFPHGITASACRLSAAWHNREQAAYRFELLGADALDLFSSDR